jgi:hypothetical protein
MQEEHTTQPVGEVAEMTKPLDSSVIDDIQKGFDSLDGAETTAEVKTEDKTDVEPEVKEVAKEEYKTETEDKPEPNLSIKEPTRHEGESDTQYQLRTDIWRAGRAKAAAETEEEKSLISDHIKELRKELGKSHYESKEKVETTSSTKTDTTEETVDEEVAREALRKLGYVDKNEVNQMVAEILSKSRQEQEIATAEKEHSSAITDFYNQRKDIAADKEQRTILETYVLDNFQITPSTSKAKLMANMEMAANYLFPKVSKTANAQTAETKRSIGNISSDGRASQTDEGLAKEMRDAGFSDEDIKKSGW